MIATRPAVPRKPKRNDIAVKLDAEIVRKARIMAAYRELPLAELLSDTLRPVIDRDFAKFKAELAADKSQK